MITKEYCFSNELQSTINERATLYITEMMRIHENFTSIENYQEIAIARRAYK